MATKRESESWNRSLNNRTRVHATTSMKKYNRIRRWRGPYCKERRSAEAYMATDMQSLIMVNRESNLQENSLPNKIEDARSFYEAMAGIESLAIGNTELNKTLRMKKIEDARRLDEAMAGIQSLAVGDKGLNPLAIGAIDVGVMSGKPIEKYKRCVWTRLPDRYPRPPPLVDSADPIEEPRDPVFVKVQFEDCYCFTFFIPLSSLTVPAIVEKVICRYPEMESEVFTLEFWDGKGEWIPLLNDKDLHRCIQVWVNCNMNYFRVRLVRWVQEAWS